MEHIAYKPLRNSSRLSALLSALGMSIFLSNGMMLSQGVSDRAYPDVFGISGLEFMGARITYGQIFILILAFALMVALQLFVQKTKLGKAMRATAQNKPMSRMLGINVDRTIRTTFIIGPGPGRRGRGHGRPPVRRGPVRHGLHLHDQGLCRGHSGRQLGPSPGPCWEG